ncbi:zinc-binding dehydrogenase [Actinosynnema sp. NPDC002837]
MHTRFGPPEVVRVVESAVPVPGKDDVLIEVRATTVTSAECAMRRGEPRWGRVVNGASGSIGTCAVQPAKLFGACDVVFGMSVRKNAGLLVVKEMTEDGRLRVVVDRTYPLERIAEAHRYVDSGHKRGNVVISVVD